ncbi:hypothetical protein PtA15_3A452 [Puccinia triticina]|uniref:Uncharacterized protein n=1 Tax=Puccinia triticina TaxID=208348 RepID=A0ABY7CE93_9BASI|nr:uncharacterized protein PtA15_3A452 [Puccinia triticina]WAQ83085.1 hypothetical protein PtA15_3A452 [Puccinia triticina]
MVGGGLAKTPLVARAALVNAAKIGEPCPSDRVTVCFSPKDYNNKEDNVKNVPVDIPNKDGCMPRFLGSNVPGENDAAAWRTRCCKKSVLIEKKLAQEPFAEGTKFNIPKEIMVNGRSLEDPDQAPETACN